MFAKYLLFEFPSKSDPAISLAKWNVVENNTKWSQSQPNKTNACQWMLATGPIYFIPN